MSSPDPFAIAVADLVLDANLVLEQILPVLPAHLQALSLDVLESGGRLQVQVDVRVEGGSSVRIVLVEANGEVVRLFPQATS